MEEWRDIEGFEGSYQISNLGRVKSLARCWHNKLSGKICKAESIMRQSQHYKGHMTILLRRNSKKEKHYVHRLVAQAFIPNPEKKDFVNHKDLHKQHNTVDNLEWNTPGENTRHYFAHVDDL